MHQTLGTFMSKTKGIWVLCKWKVTWIWTSWNEALGTCRGSRWGETIWLQDGVNQNLGEAGPKRSSGSSLGKHIIINFSFITSPEFSISPYDRNLLKKLGSKVWDEYCYAPLWKCKDKLTSSPLVLKFPQVDKTFWGAALIWFCLRRFTLSPSGLGVV